MALIGDRCEAREHVAGFGESVERNTVANREEFVPHREDVRIFVRGIDRVLRFPFGNFDNRPVARTHDRRFPIGHESFFAQSRNTVTHELQQFLFFSGLGAISYDDNNAFHKIDIMIMIPLWGKQFEMFVCVFRNSGDNERLLEHSVYFTAR